MPKEQSPGKPTTRRYTPQEKADAVRMVRTLRAELGTEHGTVQRVAKQYFDTANRNVLIFYTNRTGPARPQPGAPRPATEGGTE